MLINFPNYSKNPWQTETTQTAAPMEVRVIHELIPQECSFFHVSWEDKVLRRCSDTHQANSIVRDVEKFLEVQSRKSKIVWTIHNLHSHDLEFLEAEESIRKLLFEFSNLIFILSEKHYFMVPEKFHNKVRILNHYLLSNPLKHIGRFKSPTLFKFGAIRKEKSNEEYLTLLKNKTINKFVSDDRVKSEVGWKNGIITNREFSECECNLYSQLSNFSLFFRDPLLNSGVFNYYLSNKLIIFHNAPSVKYFEFPDFLSEFCVDIKNIKFTDFDYYLDVIRNNEVVLDAFIEQRSPKKISTLFWKYLLEL